MLRIGLPLGGVGLIVGFLLGIAIYADGATRAGVLGLSDSLLRSIQQRIALQVSAYLQPVAHAALLAHSMLGRGAATDRVEEAYRFAASVLAQTPQIDNVLFADAAGNFLLIRRAAGAPAGTTESKRVLLSAGGRVVEWITRDGAGQIVARRQDPTDDYDARTRAWFIGARAVDDLFWSRLYVFFSARAPGITAAVHGPAPDPDVIGMDLRLDALSQFLGGLSIGRTGRAYVVAANGEMIAGPDMSHLLRTRDGKLVPAQVDEVGDADLAASWDHFRAEGSGSRIIEAGGRRLISIVTPLAGAAQDWRLLITVPEDEFSGFITVNSRRAVLLSLVVVGLAAILAVLLVRQGLRADHADRAVAERSEAVRQQSAAFARLATEAGMFDTAGAPPTGLTETLARATGAQRAGLWHLLAGGHVLRCEDSFEPATGGHVGGLELSREEVPALIEALARGEEIDAAVARHDHRTASLHALLMAGHGGIAVFIVPILRVGPQGSTRGTIGMLLLEDARSDPAARDIARACASLVALRAPAEALPADRPGGDGNIAVPSPGPFTAPTPDEHGLDAALAAYGLNVAGLGVRAGARAAVLVLRLPDADIARVTADAAGVAASLAHRIACAAQEIASAQAIPYLKMMGATIVAATGLDLSGDAETAGATRRLADMAIALRECCAAAFESADGSAEFRLGLDVGLVLGGTLGAPPGLLNLWGEALQGAEALANSAPDGAIQASEQAYRLLRQDFLFRPRGLFHRPRLGESRSYLLAGRV